MSVNLMSAIFEAEFFDLKDENENITKASTAKLILLAMADHANDEGEGAYPSIERLCKKTALSAQTIRNTFDALRFNGVISLEGKSKYNTNNHTINTKSFPRAVAKETVYLTLYPLDPLMSTATPLMSEVSSNYPLDPNHHITNKESSTEILKTDEVPGQYRTKPTARADRTEEEQTILDDLKMAALLQTLSPKSIQDAMAKYFKLTPRWDTKDGSKWMEWAMETNVTPEQIEQAAELWRVDKRFNWSIPTLKGIHEHWLELSQVPAHNEELTPMGESVWL
jgi:hypothetical protein